MRIFRLIATPVILLGLLGFLGWGFMWGWRELTAPLPTTPPTPCVVEKTDIVNPSMVSVRVLNGGFTTGLGRRTGTYLTDNGYQVVEVDDTEELVKETIIRGSWRERPMMELLGSHFVEPKMEYDDRITGIVDVLIGTDFRGFTPAEETLKEVPSNDGEICRPPQITDTTPSPSPSPSPTTES